MMIYGCIVGCESSNRGASTYSYDAGVLIYPHVSQIEHEFIAVNPLSVPLIIHKLVSSCSCTGSTVSKQVIQPNETFSVVMRVKLPSIRSSAVVSSELETEPPLSADQSTFSVHYTIIPEIQISADSLDFGLLPKGEIDHSQRSQAVDVTFADNGSRPFVDLASIEAPRQITIEEDKSTSKLMPAFDKGVHYRYKRFIITPSPTRNSESFSFGGEPQCHTIVLRFTNGATRAVKSCWSHESDYRVSPQAISFGFIEKVDETVSCKLLIRYAGSKTIKLSKVRLLGIDPNAAQLKYAFSSASSESDTATISIKFKQLPVQRFLQGKLELTSPDDPSICVTVPWSAFRKGGD